MDKGILTAVDANLNRALEGLRVCEDIFRFIIHNPVSEEIKILKHRITSLSKFLSVSDLLNSRDVGSDSQKFIDTRSEMKRDGVEDIFRSNIRRAAEALRVLEEFSKINDASVSSGFQQARFDVYDIEKRCWNIIEKKAVLDRFRNSLYAIIDSSFVESADIIKTAEILVSSGADIIQLRMKNIADGVYLYYAEQVCAVCREHGAVFIVNDRADIALLSSAHGVHLGQDDISPSKIHGIAGNGFITGLSTHSISDTDTEGFSSADYIAVGPIYSTSSKTGEKIEGIGTEIAGRISSVTDKPLVGIGGITASNAEEVLDAGFTSIALISELYRNGKIEYNTKKISEILRSRIQ